MAEKQETADDIIAEMLGARTEFPFVYLMGEPDTPEVIDLKTNKIIEPRKINIRRVTVKELADRLKAALRRERVGVAKLRKVAIYLTSIFDCSTQFLERRAKELLRGTGAYGDVIIEHILHSIRLAHAALAATEQEGGANG